MVTNTTLVVLGAITLFLFGIGIGWFLTRTNTTQNISNPQLIIGIAVTIVWVVSIAAEIIVPAYTASLLVHGIMGAVVGYLFSNDGFTINIGP